MAGLQQGVYTLSCLVSVSFFFLHPIHQLLSSHLFLLLPLLVVTQIGGHIRAGYSSPPAPNYGTRLDFLWRDEVALSSSLVDSRRIVVRTHAINRRSRQLSVFREIKAPFLVQSNDMWDGNLRVTMPRGLDGLEGLY